MPLHAEIMSSIIPQLLSCYNEKHEAIEAWFEARRNEAPPYIYNSVDLRHSGHKLVPVDTNVFPAGFNNLSPASKGRAVAALDEYLARIAPASRKVLIIPENHTRNLGYLDNLAVLTRLFEQAGATVRLGSLLAEPEAPIRLTAPDGTVIDQYPLIKRDGVLRTADGFIPDLIVLNNDLTAGFPALLEGVTQPIAPPPSSGWYRRRKSVHFAAYDRLARDLAGQCGFDPWLISTLFHRCGLINFHERTGIECVALGVEKVLHGVREKYKQYGIKDEPYVFVKADSGTYGMGIMTARSGDEIYAINKKTRNKMNVIKEGTQNSEVIIQEGVPTVDAVNGNPAEPVIYLVDGKAIGGAYRINAKRDKETNLNAAGMEFTGMCDEKESAAEKEKVTVANCNYSVFGVIARLAAHAAAREEA